MRVQPWHDVPWLFLLVDLQIFTVYVRYLLARVSFFVFWHGFIFVTFILVFGIAYSRISNRIIDSIRDQDPKWSSIAIALTLCVEELLYQALETEKGGIQVYETALKCVVDADLKKEWEEYLEQTHNHERILLEVMEKLGRGPSSSMNRIGEQRKSLNRRSTAAAEKTVTTTA